MGDMPDSTRPSEATDREPQPPSWAIAPSPTLPDGFAAPPEGPARWWSVPLYGARLVLYRRRLRRALELLDQALRDGVAARDEALAALGEATLSDAAHRPGGRITAFAETLAALDAERAEFDRRRESLTIELAAAEADRRARLAEYDGRLDALDAELAPVERSLAEHHGQRDDLDREAEAAADLRQSLRARLAQLDEAHEDADDDTRRRHAEERPEIERRLLELDAERVPREASRAALDGPIERLEARVAELTAARTAAREARATWLEEVDTRIAELRATRDEELAALARSDARRRGALVDLGREALHLADGPHTPAAAARAALERIVALRRTRAELQAIGAGLDDRPLRRMLALLALLVVGLLILRGC